MLQCSCNQTLQCDAHTPVPCGTAGKRLTVRLHALRRTTTTLLFAPAIAAALQCSRGQALQCSAHLPVLCVASGRPVRSTHPHNPSSRGRRLMPVSCSAAPSIQSLAQGHVPLIALCASAHASAIVTSSTTDVVIVSSVADGTTSMRRAEAAAGAGRAAGRYVGRGSMATDSGDARLAERERPHAGRPRLPPP